MYIKKDCGMKPNWMRKKTSSGEWKEYTRWISLEDIQEALADLKNNPKATHVIVGVVKVGEQAYETALTLATSKF